jgi:hypothetical protein
LGIIECGVVFRTVFIAFTKVWVLRVGLLMRTSVVSVACLRTGVVIMFNSLV